MCILVVKQHINDGRVYECLPRWGVQGLSTSVQHACIQHWNKLKLISTFQQPPSPEEDHEIRKLRKKLSHLELKSEGNSLILSPKANTQHWVLLQNQGVFI